MNSRNEADATWLRIIVTRPAIAVRTCRKPPRWFVEPQGLRRDDRWRRC
jgi:hypothetical protein